MANGNCDDMYLEYTAKSKRYSQKGCAGIKESDLEWFVERVKELVDSGCVDDNQAENLRVHSTWINIACGSPKRKLPSMGGPSAKAQ